MKTLKTFRPCWTVHAVLVLTLAVALALGGAVAVSAVQGGLPAVGEVPAGLTAADWASLRGQIEAPRYRAAADREGGYAAANPAHGWAVAYRSDGTTRLAPPGSAEPGWRWGLRLSGYGYGTLRRVDRPQALAAGETSVTYAWDGTIAEWWINTAAGLEQGFTVRLTVAPPPKVGFGRDHRRAANQK